ncbi:hypothetical protein POM88_037331 [Heracleum sosnowskyi]|uniref:Uncharacterized protein n=1 Tax=Heracleum sosnowskyi TaxID=360622 RepID=A0AAD8MFU2_9APIA|nr:hypothetical protein POM88_037331 [Heracleum sosnowskyi]
MKSIVGRPRKRVRNIKNPFDLGLSRKKVSKSFKNAKKAKGRSISNAHHLDIPPVLDDKETDNLNEAGQILKCAEDLGLSFQGNREEVVKSIASQLDEGIKRSVVRGNINESVTLHSVNILCLQETKCETWDNVMKNSIWDKNSHGWVVQRSVGNSSGLACSWDSSIFSCIGISQSQNWIWLQLKHTSSQELINIINVYSPLKSSGKKKPWKVLGSRHA